MAGTPTAGRPPYESGRIWTSGRYISADLCDFAVPGEGFEPVDGPDSVVIHGARVWQEWVKPAEWELYDEVETW